MKYAALIFAILSGALKAEIPAGATDLVPRTDSPALERLNMKNEPVTTTTYSEITITSLDSTSSIEMPPLTLSEIIPEGCEAIPPKVITITPTEKKTISDMPVITADKMIDNEIIIQTPDPSINHALITKEIDMTPNK